MAIIRIIAVGKLKEPYFCQAQAEYLKRLRPYYRLELLELPDLPCAASAGLAQQELVRQKEAAAIQSQIKPPDFLVTLDRQGKEWSSLELAQFLKEWEQRGQNLVLAIGGSLGLAADLVKQADLNLSFSRLTFPHQLFRIILLEQLYRAGKINCGAIYHK